MPLLTKRPFMKQRSIHNSQSNKISDQKKFKTPLLTRENIDKILTNDVNLYKKQSVPKEDEVTNITSSCSQYDKSNNAFTKQNLIKTKSNSSIMSMHLSFENSQNSDALTDISFRMNEPKIKEAYIQFVKRLSQSSSKKFNITSSPLTQKSNENNILSLETSLQKIGELSFEKAKTDRKAIRKITSNKFKTLGNKKTRLNKKIFTKNQNSEQKKTSKMQVESRTKISSDSGISLSQEVLNQKEVKTAYVEFFKSSLENNNDLQRTTKGVEKKKKRKCIIRSSSEESLNEPIVTEKLKQFNKVLPNQKVCIGEDIDVLKKRTKRQKETNKTSEKFLEQVKNRKHNSKEKLRQKTLKHVLTEDNSSTKNLPKKERMALIQESRNVGLYALCDTCNKARYLPHIKDPLDLPDKWYCAMNPDKSHNKCSDSEEVEEDDDYLINNLYNAGSVVWAKMDGYPWWPAMVDDDPDEEVYFWLEGHSMIPTWYHVTFFDSEDVTRAWTRPLNLKPFKINMNNPEFHTPAGNKYRSRVCAALKQARDAIELPLIDRLKQFSFINRYDKPLKIKKIKQKPSKKRIRKKETTRSHMKNKLLGHMIESSKEQSPSLCSKNKVEPKFVRVNCKNADENSSTKNNENEDMSIIFNDVNWIESQNLSFNLFD